MGMGMAVDCCPLSSLTILSCVAKSSTGVAREVSGGREDRFPATAE